MKATKKQIKKSLDNTFEIGVDGSEELYLFIRNAEYEAIQKAFIPRSYNHYTKKDFDIIYRNIQMILKKIKTPIV